MGMDATNCDTFPAPAPNPGLNGVAILYDTTKGSLLRRAQEPFVRRGTVCVFADQIVTVKIQVLLPGSSTWRTYNGGGAGEATVANVLFARDALAIGADFRVIVETTTAPTLWEAGFRLHNDRTPGM